MVIDDDHDDDDGDDDDDAGGDDDDDDKEDMHAYCINVNKWHVEHASTWHVIMHITRDYHMPCV